MSEEERDGPIVLDEPDERGLMQYEQPQDISVGPEGRFIRVDWCSYAIRSIDIADPESGRTISIDISPGDRVTIRQHGSGAPANPLRVTYLGAPGKKRKGRRR